MEGKRVWRHSLNCTGCRDVDLYKAKITKTVKSTTNKYFLRNQKTITIKSKTILIMNEYWQLVFFRRLSLKLILLSVKKLTLQNLQLTLTKEQWVTNCQLVFCQLFCYLISSDSNQKPKTVKFTTKFEKRKMSIVLLPMFESIFRLKAGNKIPLGKRA